MAILPDAVVDPDRARVQEQQAGPAWPVCPAWEQRAVHHAVLGQALGHWAQAGDHHDVGSAVLRVGVLHRLPVVGARPPERGQPRLAHVPVQVVHLGQHGQRTP